MGVMVTLPAIESPDTLALKDKVPLASEILAEQVTRVGAC